jgi:hypothetical protein
MFPVAAVVLCPYLDVSFVTAQSVFSRPLNLLRATFRSVTPCFREIATSDTVLNVLRSLKLTIPGMPAAKSFSLQRVQ